MLNELEAELVRSAPSTDRHDGTLAKDLAKLGEAGFNVVPLPCRLGGQGWATGSASITDCFDFLRMLGRANLSVGRLFEGHLNALKLIELYGTAEQLEETATMVKGGAWYGVWGADTARPVTAEHGMLQGEKRFASGIGVIDRAVVPVGAGSRCQLYLVPSDAPDRGDASKWRMSGMRATRSGSYDFTGVEGAAIGKPGDYLREPWFEGGVWRYCAVHCGGAEALRDEAVRTIVERGQADAPRQSDRMARLAMLCETIRLWVLEAAMRVEGPGNDPRRGAAYALLAREQTELACLEVIALADRAMGTIGHVDGSRADRVRRDLGLFLRQADIDGKLHRAAGALHDVCGIAENL